MALNTTTGTATLSDELKTFYDRRLIARALPMLVHRQFAQKRNIPRNGGKTIEFRAFETLGTAGTPLTEGVPPTLQDLTATAFTATVAQYGGAVGLSDIVSTVTIDPILVETVDLLAEQAAETMDEEVRDVLVTGTNVQYASTATLRSQISSAMTLTVAELREGLLQLKVDRAKPINGSWVAIVHPRTMHDIQGTTEWITANQYAGSKRIFDGSVGSLYGIEFVVSDKAAVFPLSGLSSLVDVYATLLLGANAFGIVDLAGHNLQTFHKPLGSAGTADPINQQQSFGWKVTFVAKILTDEYMLRIEHAVSTS